jgi:murein DD-endopeptidase MepM/ murein hydrolase activator NlpD
MFRAITLLAIAVFAFPQLHPRPLAAVANQERKVLKLAAAIYDTYVGQYQLTPDFVITVRREEDGLSIQATNQPKFEIFAESETKFFLTAVDAQITFVKDDNGQVSHLILHQNGLDQSARRVNSPRTTEAATRTGRQASTVQRPIDLPIEMMVPTPPTPVKGDGKIHAAYELHLTNFSGSELVLTRLDVLGNSDNQLAQYDGQELAALLGRPGLPQSSDKQRLGGGMRAVVYVWLSFDAPSAVPSAVKHRLTATIGSSGGSGGELEIKGTGAEVRMRTEPILVLAPPLRGDGWLAANGPSNVSGHRRALLPISGASHIAQRFAIDWVQLREDGKTWAGDRFKNTSYRAYGAEALAVGDGVVVGVKDGIPENIPGPTSRAVAITLETVGGNYVTLDLGKGRYAFYAHLQPGSLKVKLHDKVRRGQLLGLVGNSGNSTEPHLHFHISDTNSPLGSEGLPYVFESFELQGHGWGWKKGNEAPVKRQLEIPMQNGVVSFRP